MDAIGLALPDGFTPGDRAIAEADMSGFTAFIHAADSGYRRARMEGRPRGAGDRKLCMDCTKFGKSCMRSNIPTDAMCIGGEWIAVEGETNG